MLNPSENQNASDRQGSAESEPSSACFPLNASLIIDGQTKFSVRCGLVGLLTQLGLTVQLDDSLQSFKTIKISGNVDVLELDKLISYVRTLRLHR